MIEIENAEVTGWEAAIRGMRNPMNSWEKSDSQYIAPRGGVRLPLVYSVGSNDRALMMKLCKAGADHRKFMRMVAVHLDIIAPLYWWKEFDTYKVGTVANSCSTMHKIADKEFTLEDFSCEHLLGKAVQYNGYVPTSVLECTIGALNEFRKLYLESKNKVFWWQMIQLLPSSYNQRRTVMLNYEVLANIYKSRRNHKLDEWRELCNWIEDLPYSELITGELDGTDNN